MREEYISKIKEVIFGVFIGVYGNIIVSFIDRIKLPTIMNKIYYLQYMLILIFIATFMLYILFMYRKTQLTTFLWLIHVPIPTLVFIIQDSYHEIKYFYDNVIFCVVQIIFMAMILTGEWIIYGKARENTLKNRWKGPFKIGILNDMGWDTSNTQIFSWSNISLDEWKERFSSEKDVNIEFIKTEDNFDPYVAIVNPYGGVYPENDLKKLTTLNYILEYVNNGGIFVNVADVPTYWAYIKKLKKRMDNTRPIYAITNKGEIIAQRPFTLTPLIEELGLEVYNMDLSPIPQNLDEYSTIHHDFISKRIAIVVPNVESCIPTTKLNTLNQKNVDSTALFFSSYGEGEFLISLFFINDNMYTEEHKIIFRETIVKNLINKIRNKAI